MNRCCPFTPWQPERQAPPLFFCFSPQAGRGSHLYMSQFHFLQVCSHPRAGQVAGGLRVVATGAAAAAKAAAVGSGCSKQAVGCFAVAVCGLHAVCCDDCWDGTPLSMGGGGGGSIAWHRELGAQGLLTGSTGSKVLVCCSGCVHVLCHGQQTLWVRIWGGPTGRWAWCYARMVCGSGRFLRVSCRWVSQHPAHSAACLVAQRECTRAGGWCIPQRLVDVALCTCMYRLHACLWLVVGANMGCTCACQGVCVWRGRGGGGGLSPFGARCGASSASCPLVM
jgi:hypothetical protein